MRLLDRLIQRLTEAGKRHSVADEGMIQEMHDHAVALGARCGVAESLTEAERSLGQQQEILASAVRLSFGSETAYTYLDNIFDTYLVFCASAAGSRRLYQVDYQISAADVVTFGSPTEVVSRIVYEPVGQADLVTESGVLTGEVVPLVERAIKDDGTTLIKVIKAGWGSSGFYPRDVLLRDAPTAFPTGTHMHIDHPTAQEAADRPERSVATLAAVTTGPAQWRENGPEGPGAYAPAKVKASHRQDLEDVSSDIGVSIYASGSYQIGEADGRKGRIVTSLAASPTNTIDFVTRPGAGGKLVSLLESRRQASPAPISTPLSEEEPPMALSDQDAQALREAQATQTQELARLREALILRDARDVVRDELAGIDMLDLTRKRLQESLVINPPVADSVLDMAALRTKVREAATAELEYLAKTSGAGKIAGMGQTREAAGAELSEADLASMESELTAGFQKMGLSEAAAKQAASR